VIACTIISDYERGPPNEKSLSRCIPSNWDGGVAECSGQKEGPESW